MRSIMFLLTVTLVAFATANEHFCPEKVLGKPSNECGLYGLEALGKDDRNQQTSTRNAELAIVKAGTCYTLFPDVDVGDTLFAQDGKDISHVTYCGAAKQPEPTPEDAPEPEVPPTPATCELVAQSSRTCKRISKRKEHCTACVTSACRACRDVFVKHCVHPTPVDSVEACLEARGGPCRKKRGSKARKCLSGLRRQCESHVCDQQPALPEDAPEPITPGVPAVCQLTPRNAKTCRKLAKAKEHCTACVTSACKACRGVFEHFCENPEPVASVDSCLAARGGPCFRKKGRKREKCLNGLRRQCEEHQCTRPPVVVDPAPPVVPEPVPEVIRHPPVVVAPPPATPVVDPVRPPVRPAVTPQAPQAAPCVPRTKRRLKIRGEGKACKDAPHIRRKVKELKSKVACLLAALSGEIPKEKIVVDKPPPKVIRETIKVVKPGKWIKQPDEIVEKEITKIINPATKAPKPKPQPKPKADKPKRRRRRPPANARQVDINALKALAKKKLEAAKAKKRRRRRRRRRPANGRVVRRRRRRRRRRPANGRVVRRRRRRRRRPANGRVVRRRRRRRRRRRPANGRVVRRRRRRRRGRPVRRRRRRRRGGRAVRRRRRRRRGGRAVRRRRRRRRGGRAVRRRRPARRRRPRPRNTRA